ncbi:MAG: hypothetical protein ACRC2R_14830 [Xenococcaceae cyanobacterium]
MAQATESSSVVTSKQANAVELQEGWKFAFENYAIEHQGNSVVDINVSYDYADGLGAKDPTQYPDFVPIYNFINDFLIKYPNETDFWEIVNKNLVTTLLTQPIPTPYGVEYNLNKSLDSLTIEMNVKPGSSGINTPRSTIVTGRPKSKDELTGSDRNNPLVGGKDNTFSSFESDLKFITGNDTQSNDFEFINTFGTGNRDLTENNTISNPPFLFGNDLTQAIANNDSVLFSQEILV